MTETDCRKVIWEDTIREGQVPIRVITEPVNAKCAQVWVTMGHDEGSIPWGEGGARESGYFKSEYPEPTGLLDKILYKLFGGPETFEEVLERKIQKAQEFVDNRRSQELREQVGCTRMKQELQEIHETK